MAVSGGARAAYVLAVSCQQRLWVEFKQKRLATIAKDIPAGHWHRLNVGEGSKGQRIYDRVAAASGVSAEGGLRRWVLFRRGIEKPEECAYYLCLAPVDVTIRELVEAARQEAGLDEYEVRS